jgi:hypothetical protein
MASRALEPRRATGAVTVEVRTGRLWTPGAVVDADQAGRMAWLTARAVGEEVRRVDANGKALVSEVTVAITGALSCAAVVTIRPCL